MQETNTSIAAPTSKRETSMTHESLAAPQVQVTRYTAPRVQITPVTDVITSPPLRWPGHYQNVLLNTRTGELRFHENTESWEPWDQAWKAINDVPRETWKRWHPGTPFFGVGPHSWFEEVPELLSWTIDSGVEELPYLDVDAANALLAELTPYAQELVDNLFDAGGDLDWSAASARAGRNIRRLCSRHRKAAPADADGDLADYSDIVARFPKVYQPELLRRPLDQLPKDCELITRYLGCNERWHEDIKKVFGAPHHDGSGIGLDVLGVRAWYRTVLMGGDPRPLKEFRDWDAEHDRLAASDLTSASTDTEVEAWADREEENAARQGWRLLHVHEAGRAYRAQLRARDWDRLAVVGADVASMEEADTPYAEEDLEPVRAERLALASAAIGWGRSDSEVALRARMSRQAVRQLRDDANDTTAGPKSK
jgi:hypothetical protein